jgi:hypothetical protein
MFPSNTAAASDAVHPVKSWVFQFSSPQQALQVLQGLSGIPDGECAAVLFSFDGQAAATGGAMPFACVAKLTDADVASKEAHVQQTEQQPSPPHQQSSSSNEVGVTPEELSQLLHVSPPAGTVSSWDCVLHAHPQGLSADTLADMLRHYSSSRSSSGSSSDVPSPVQSWLLPQLLDEDRPALLVCEPAADAAAAAMAVVEVLLQLWRW